MYKGRIRWCECIWCILLCVVHLFNIFIAKNDNIRALMSVQLIINIF